MSGDTHASAGLTAGLAVVACGSDFSVVAVVGMCWSVAGSLFPDLDQPRSKGNKLIAKVLPFVLAALCLYVLRSGSNFSLKSPTGLRVIGTVGILLLAFFCKTRPHREFSHSLLAVVAASLCVVLCSGSFAGLCFGAGYLSHLGLDLLNNKGESLLYPSRQKFCFGVCSADGKANRIVGIVCNCLSVLLFVGGVL